MRITVAHEWLTNWAGSERVMAEMAQISGARSLVAGIVDPAFARRYFPDMDVTGLWPSRLPAAQTRWSRYGLPLMAAWAGVKVDADALLVSSHWAAHGATLRFDGPSIVYYHTPARMLWRPDMELDRLPRLARTAAGALALPPLRQWDRHVGQQPTVVLANSTAIADRISRAYRRSATVLYPPVDVQRWSTVERRDGRHLLHFGRLVAYKKPWVAVEAAHRVGRPLIVIGDGPERARLERDAPPGVTFLGHASESQVREALAHSSALLFPGEEDFGIVPIEALAAGVPVIAYDAGGARDYVRHGENGLLVPSQDAEAFADAVRQAERTDWDEKSLRRSAEGFSPEAFRSGFAQILESVLGSAWRR
jgi:glycosyltransferase involved in cell wall biosynthesis